MQNDLGLPKDTKHLPQGFTEHLPPCPLIINQHAEELPQVSRENSQPYRKIEGGYELLNPVDIERANLQVSRQNQGFGKTFVPEHITVTHKQKKALTVTNAQINQNQLDPRKQFNEGDELSGLQAIEQKKDIQFYTGKKCQQSKGGIQLNFGERKGENVLPQPGNCLAFNCQNGKANEHTAHKPEILELNSSRSYEELVLSCFDLTSYKVIVQKEDHQFRVENSQEFDQIQSIQQQNRMQVKLIRDEGKHQKLDFLQELKRLQNEENNQKQSSTPKANKNDIGQHSQRFDYRKAFGNEQFQSRLIIWPQLEEYSLEYDEFHQIQENCQFEASQSINQAKYYLHENFGDGDIAENSQSCLKANQSLGNGTSTLETKFNVRKSPFEFEDSKDVKNQISALEMGFSKGLCFNNSSSCVKGLACNKLNCQNQQSDQFADSYPQGKANYYQFDEKRAFQHYPEIELENEDFEEHTCPITIMQQRHMMGKDINNQRIFEQ
ncbi:hypothetical protein FGO68_gene2195 [Halteria grandinella]|uniref:Uncharacterized protein n=1 Tax=Halteria grandinella TaxID=5974 RepID=A0A8J8T3H3_HALGN|nr:hypothetical protein FGO68_gene2195 [Halteria grandinella]